jgi:ATP-dependent DNA helicase RecG
MLPVMRPEILYPLFAPANTLKGVGKKLEPLVEKAAGPLVRDLVFSPPSSLIERPDVTLDEAREGEVQTVVVTIDQHQPARRQGLPYRIRCFGENGFISLIYFKVFGDSLQRQHPVGAVRVASGRIDRFNGELQMTHPDYLLPPERKDDLPRVETIYSTVAGLAPRVLRKLVLEALDHAPELPEWQDAAWVARERLPSWREALERLHNPQNPADLLPDAPERRRLAYDELFAHQLAMAERKAARRKQPAEGIGPSAVADRLQAALPFALTGAQHRSLAEIRADLGSGERMSRLLQGDVGAGKTVVAMLVMADAAAAGRQSVLMAPTEILARQHFETIEAPLAAQGIRAVLLTGRDRGANRAEKLAALASGGAQVAVGTHALFQAVVTYQALALTVIDEQHRFGGSDRRRLQEKGEAAHLLAMSATPIPRTLELTLYGDLEVSRLDEKPPGRKPVATRAVPLPRQGEIVQRLKAAVAGGAQAFWICPLVSESEVSDLANAEARAEALRQQIGPRVGLVHGQLPPAQKDAVMADFADGKLDVLVATTVVEVGVNVPNATIMVIEHADRFGLAQLHQLRGRVGRGERESACVLLYDPPLGKTAEARLNILRETEDGFLIAEKDLELRGGGDPLGLKQSGFPAYRLADPVAHRHLIAVAADDARLLLQKDPGLTTPRGQAVRILKALFDWRPEGFQEAG